MSNESPHQMVDAVIVGGGMVGSTLALILGQCGYRVLLVEQFTPRAMPADPDMRTMALTHASQVFLAKCGLWDALRHRAARMEAVCVTAEGQWGSSHLTAPQHQDGPALGYVVGVGDIGKALDGALANQPEVTLLRPAKVIAHHPEEDHWRVTIETADGTQDVNTRLLIAADGAGSALAKSHQIQYQNTVYHHTAICANVVLETKTPNTAHERFLKAGALALLPWVAPYATCVWTIEGPADRLMDLSDEEYMKACQQAFGRRIGRLVSMGKRYAYPLTMCVAPHQTAWRFLVMGNAAHQLHPIAAQGLNLSLQDMAYLFSQLRSVHKPTDIGSASFLADYQEARWPQQSKVIKTTAALAKMMSSEAMTSRLRGMGITLFDMLPPLKQRFTQWGMGAI